jgi:hypothetical protein
MLATKVNVTPTGAAAGEFFEPPPKIMVARLFKVDIMLNMSNDEEVGL